MLYFEREMIRLRAEMGYDTESSQRVVRAKNLMDLDYAGPHSLASLARGAMVSPFHFARRFRRLYGTSPARYLTDVRIRKSMALLSEGHSVLDTCYQVGFGSPTSFAGLFKRKTGVSPSSFRSAGIVRLAKKAGSERQASV
ncbi:MAG: AraC family transcriptional regulator [Chitinophagaceae bacterium]|nr:MAG: AraC family transcriptional regulator [Chitinophagaceae bacterium]